MIVEALTSADAAWFAQRHEALLHNVERAIRGKTDVLRLALAALFSEGHLLIEDVPGVGKTSIAKAMAASIHASWHRIQFTPDLLPSDITGVSVWNEKTRKFEFRSGPIFANVVVGDEINRASPKTQSALLEVMEERQVTVDAKPWAVPRPFLVLATQNPIDLEGTYRLPEAQLDRFLLRIAVGYPDEESEVQILSDRAALGAPLEVGAVLGLEDVVRMIAMTTRVHVAPAVARYVVSLVNITRSLPEVRLGVSPRGTLALLRAAQSRAVAEGRTFVTPHDVKVMAQPVMAHRMLLSPEAELQRRTVGDLLTSALAAVPVPGAVNTR